MQQKLLFAIDLRPGCDFFPVGRKGRKLRTRGTALGESPDQALFPGARDENVAARFENNSLAVFRECPGLELGLGIDESLAHLEPVAGELNGNHMIICGGQVISPNVHLVLINNLSVSHGRPAHIVIFELCKAFDIAAIGVHRGEIRPPPTVGDKINATVCGPHRERILAVVLRDLGELEVLDRAHIDFFRLAAFITLPVMELQAQLLKSDPLSVGFIANPCRRFEWNQFRQAALR